MNKLRFILLFFWGIFIFLGCHKWGEPEFKVNEWKDPSTPVPFWTIGSKSTSDRKCILAKHVPGTSPDSIVTSYKGNIYVKAVVVSSDEGGNYFKKMAIQDSTGGVELQLDMTGLYTIYPVGQKIVLICNGLVIGDYGKLPQVGWLYQGTQVGRINSLFFNNYIIKDGLASKANLPKILTNNEIDFIGQRDINKLVRLERVKFRKSAIGQPFAYDGFTTEWYVDIPVGNTTQTVNIRTSNYAKFRNMIIEDKEYNLTGILTYFSSSKTPYQLMIRVKEDIEFSKPNESITFDFSTNPIGEGKWSNYTLTGTKQWGFRNSVVMHAGNKSDNTFMAVDDWFVSPTITYPDMQKGYLRFEHQLNVSNGYYDAYQVYYTTSNSVSFNKDEWKPLGVINSFPSSFDWSNRFPLSKINANSFRIAFRYNAPTTFETFEWSIRKVEINNK